MMKKTRHRLVFVLLVTFCLVACGATDSLAAPVFLGVGDLSGGTVFSRANAVSDDGRTVVGASRSGLGTEAFRWTLAEGIVGMGDLPGGSFHSEAVDVSGDGSVLVGQGEQSGSSTVAVRWENGSIGDLGTFPWASFGSGALAISSDGSTIVGSSGFLLPDRSFAEETFWWTMNEGVVGLGDLEGGTHQSFPRAVSSDGSVVVGRGTVDEQGRSSATAVLWSNGEIRDLGLLLNEDGTSQAYAVSPDGSIVAGTSSNGTATFIWSEEDGPSSIGSFFPSSISGGRTRIVGYIRGSEGDQAVIWDEVLGVQILQDVLESDYGLSLDGWTLERANDITADGTVIVGVGINPLGQTEGWIVTIPEPSSLVLMLTGTVLIRRRRPQIHARL